MKKDNWKTPYETLLSDFEHVKFEVANLVKSRAQVSNDVIKSYRVKLNTLLILILTGYRFKQHSKGIEIKFKRFAKYPKQHEFEMVFNMIGEAMTLMKMLENINGVSFEEFDISKLKTLNDIRQYIDDLMCAELTSKDFAKIYQLRLDAARSMKILFWVTIGVVLVGAGVIAFFAFGSGFGGSGEDGLDHGDAFDDGLDNGGNDDGLDSGYDVED